MEFKDELFVLGLQRDNAERTINAHRLSLSFLKASMHTLEEHGIPRRQGFDLFNRDQLIVLSFGTLNTIKLGASVSRVGLA
jgi:hypothetical protein